MKLEQDMKPQLSFAMKMWLYISKPFQITKVLEILYALDWIWYAVMSFIPEKYITGSLFGVLRNFMPLWMISALLCAIAILHVAALLKNIIWLRKTALVFNIGVLLYLSVLLLLRNPLPSGAGYLVILVGVSIFAFWRMDETH